MMGRQVEQGSLFYDFSLDRHLPADHLLRSIDRFVELSELRQELAPFYSAIGRPSIDPELLIRMLVVGYCYGIRSERRLCEEVHLNLAYRWFCRLGLDGAVPEHSTFSKNRHGRFRESDLTRRLFETIVRRCIAEGLVGGEAFAVDASLIKADANKQRSAAGSEDVDWEAMAVTHRSVREYLDTLDDAAWGKASEVTPKFISKSDPAAQWTGAHKGHAFFAYADNYLIDLKAAVIVDVEATRAIRQAEVGAGRTMIDRVEERFGLYPERLSADSAYGSAEMLGWLVHERGIEPHIPVVDRSEHDDGTFSRADFKYDLKGDVYFCPAGKMLTCKGTLVNDGATLLYRASRYDCGACKLKRRCCPNTPSRKIPRSIYEGARNMARDIAKTEAYSTSRRERKKVEMLFAHLKRILRLDRLRLRGPSGAHDEFLLAAAVQNLRKLAKLIPMPQLQPA
jgi:transposase